MVLLLHIIVALASMLLATLLFLAPTSLKFKSTYALTGLTIASGTYIILTQSVSMLHACLSGLVYVALVGVAIVLAHQKSAAVIKQRTDE